MIVYYEESILSYIASIRDYFGLDFAYKPNTKFSNLLENKKPEKVVVLLIDGMGLNLMERKLDKDSFLRKHLAFKTTTVYPTVTTAATTSIRNGKSPSENGWIGWAQYFKEVDDQIICFRGKGYYNGLDYGKDFANNIISVKYTDEQLNEKGIKATSIFPSFMHNGCKDFDEICSRIINETKKGYKYIYAYWDKYDNLMHEYGPNSKVCDSYLTHINYVIEHLSKNLDEKTMLIVLSDHGQVEVKQEYNLCGSKFEKYFRMKPALEPRCMAFYIKENMLDEFEKEFKQEFEDRFILLSNSQTRKVNLFGEKLHQRYDDFVGDYVALAKSNTIFAYKEKPIPVFKGQHGGIMEDELFIPIVIN